MILNPSPSLVSLPCLFGNRPGDPPTPSPPQALPEVTVVQEKYSRCCYVDITYLYVVVEHAKFNDETDETDDDDDDDDDDADADADDDDD